MASQVQQVIHRKGDEGQGDNDGNKYGVHVILLFRAVSGGLVFR